MGRRIDEWHWSEAEMKLRDDAAKAPPRWALIYYAVCTLVLFAIMVPFSIFVAKPFADWTSETFGHWMWVPMIALGVWCFIDYRRRARRD